MTIDLPQLRAELARNPFFNEIVQLCGTGRRTQVVRLVWCEESLDRARCSGTFAELLIVFRLLENAGFGRLLQPTRRDRARFQWAVDPLALIATLGKPDGTLSPADLFPAAATFGLTLPSAEPERPGWTRHQLTLRPQHMAELLVPDDLTPGEAEWLANFIRQLGKPVPAGT